MPWLPYIPLLATSVTPVGAATGDFVTYIVSFGVLGIAAVLFGAGYIVPKPVKDSAVLAARSDLVTENQRLVAELEKTQDQRDEALNFIRDRLAPLVSEFTSSTGALIPILQGLVARLELMGQKEDRERESRRDRR